ncbi:hypothetical protein [Gilvimarinus sp. 1_MG-2023]|uniref:hypothetical protein n=1 Tax=Gilvimarinus sp. 1_MG-2023 TaxID=3062638 RepID=UPI0026E1ADA6|nr:hypothetical protein [Gilvimarinus sp. 1_MG-2023]MDO6746245.1 hypothetical protein [Gilvimarinus sp. 1_MG-2023]
MATSVGGCGKGGSTCVSGIAASGVVVNSTGANDSMFLGDDVGLTGSFGISTTVGMVGVGVDVGAELIDLAGAVRDTELDEALDDVVLRASDG